MVDGAELDGDEAVGGVAVGGGVGEAVAVARDGEGRSDEEGEAFTGGSIGDSKDVDEEGGVEGSESSIIFPAAGYR